MQKIAAQPVVYVRKGVRRGGARVYNSRAAEINCLAIQRRARLENQAKSWAGQRKLLLPIQASSLQLYLRVFGEQKFVLRVRETNAATPAQPGVTERPRALPWTITGPKLPPRLPSHRNWPARAEPSHAARATPWPSQRWITAQRRVQEPGLRLRAPTHVQEWRQIPGSE